MDNSHPLEVPVIFLKKPEQGPNLKLRGNTQLITLYVKKCISLFPE
jgi:hypothetical protein